MLIGCLVRNNKLWKMGQLWSGILCPKSRQWQTCPKRFGHFDCWLAQPITDNYFNARTCRQVNVWFGSPHLSLTDGLWVCEFGGGLNPKIVWWSSQLTTRWGDLTGSFAQWRYSNQWSNREVLLLLVENYTQYPALLVWNTTSWGNFWRPFKGFKSIVLSSSGHF